MLIWGIKHVSGVFWIGRKCPTTGGGELFEVVRASSIEEGDQSEDLVCNCASFDDLMKVYDDLKPGSVEFGVIGKVI